MMIRILVVMDYIVVIRSTNVKERKKKVIKLTLSGLGDLISDIYTFISKSCTIC